jgi:2-desacetyl-2-hydroxyethyl bacteriochlorophyllide A dehydrogenase
MRAALLTAPERIEVGDTVDPVPAGPRNALVRIESVGICGTDVSIYKGKIPVSFPRILGHELIGRVQQAAAQGEIAAGTRVLVNPSIACGRCPVCRADLEHLCPRGALIGRDVDGGFAELVAIDDDRLLPVPDTVPDDDAALLQVLGTCVHAQTSFQTFPGQTAVVIGLGVAGFLMVQLLRARGITTILGVTRSRDKDELARRFGATAVAAPDDAARVCRELSDGRGADVVIEAVGTLPTFTQAVELAALGGTVVLFGTIGRNATTQQALPFYDLYYKELTIRNPRAARHRDYQLATDLAAAGQVELAPLLTRRFPLEEAAEAVRATQQSANLKVTLNVAAPSASYR